MKFNIYCKLFLSFPIFSSPSFSYAIFIRIQIVSNNIFLSLIYTRYDIILFIKFSSICLQTIFIFSFFSQINFLKINNAYLFNSSLVE